MRFRVTGILRVARWPPKNVCEIQLWWVYVLCLLSKCSLFPKNIPVIFSFPFHWRCRVVIFVIVSVIRSFRVLVEVCWFTKFFFFLFLSFASSWSCYAWQTFVLIMSYAGIPPLTWYPLEIHFQSTIDYYAQNCIIHSQSHVWHPRTLCYANALSHVHRNQRIISYSLHRY